MKKILISMFAATILLAAGTAHAFITVNVFQDGYIDDFDNAVTIDGIPNAIDTNSQALFIGNGNFASDGKALEARGILTFNVAAFSGMTLQSATLHGFGHVNPGQTLSLFGYAGDGAITLSDYNASAQSLGNMTLPLSTSLPFNHDVAGFLQPLFTNSDTFAEFRISSNITNPFVDAVINSSETPNLDVFTIPTQPYLLLNFTDVNANVVPEPFTCVTLGVGLLGAGFLRRRKCKLDL